MNFISKSAVFLLFLSLVLTQGNTILASSLKIQDFTMHKNTQQADATVLYRYVFQPSSIAPQPLPSPMYEPLSLGETIAQQKYHSASARRSLKKTWSQLGAFIRNSAQFYWIGELEASPSLGIAILQKKANKANELSPRLSMGAHYIKPGFSFKNILNTAIHTTISYQTKEETLEAQLSKKVSKMIELRLTNTNVFTEDRVKRVVLGFSYTF